MYLTTISAPSGNGTGFDGQLVAVEKQCMAIEPVEGGHLVEDSGGHPRCGLLGSLAEKGDFEP